MLKLCLKKKTKIKKTSKKPMNSLKKQKKIHSLHSPFPQSLGFCKPKYHLWHPSLNAVAVPISTIAVHSSTRRHRPLLNTPSPSRRRWSSLAIDLPQRKDFAPLPFV
jgi:hypothetical protein